MKHLRLNLMLFLVAYCNFACSQTTPKKIKIILMGTFHFGETSDKNKTGFKDLFSEKRQKELDVMAAQLNDFGIDKIFLETDFREQTKQDTLYAKYKTGRLNDTISLRREEVQIGFRLGKIKNLPIVAADYRQGLDYSPMNKYEKRHKNDKTDSTSFFEIAYPFNQKLKKLSESTLAEYYIQMNSEYARQANMYDYLHYAMAYTKDDDYTGEQFTLSFYDRNLKIYNNILRNINLGTDSTILVLFGSAHTNILRQFFSSHPSFEIIELETIFK
jgi:hypothetical protein